MKQYLTMDDLRNSELEMLRLFRDFCNKHNLRYYLSYGTLLGAVRHHGFIPWDDDIDVLMPKEDYNYLLEHFNKENTKRYRLVSPEFDKDYYLNFAKIIDTATVLIESGETFPIGAYIDIFPLDYYPKSFFAKLRCYRFRSLIKTYNHYDDMTFSGYSFFKRTLIYLYCYTIKFVYRSRDRIKCKAHNLWKKFSKLPPNDSYAVLCSALKGIPEIPTEWFEPAEKLMFEGEEFAVPKEYHRFLTEIYGDYMQLPPESERVSNHSFECYWAEEKNN